MIHLKKNYNYDDIIFDLEKNISIGDNFYNNDEQLNESYEDKYLTQEQKNRDKIITELLRKYVDAYNYKVNSNKWYKGIIFGLCTIIVLAFSAIIVIYALNINSPIIRPHTKSIVSVISICASSFATIIGVLQIITKHVFPVDDEQYITKIVSYIQQNDLDNKRENIKVESELKNNKEDDFNPFL